MKCRFCGQWYKYKGKTDDGYCSKHCKSRDKIVERAHRVSHLLQDNCWFSYVGYCRCCGKQIGNKLKIEVKYVEDTLNDYCDTCIEFSEIERMVIMSNLLIKSINYEKIKMKKYEI